MQGTRRRASWVAGLVVGVSAVLGTTPAIAETVVDTDRISLGDYENNTVCYGCTTAVLLDWRLGDDAPPRLRWVTGYGSLGAYGPNGQRCARIKSIFRAKNGTKLAQRAGSGNGAVGNVACVPNGSGGNTHGGVPIDNGQPVRRTKLYSVTVILQTGPTNTGPWSKVGSVTCVWKTSDCNVA